MRIKPEWKEYLQNLRKRELEITFSYLTQKKFKTGLEIGAGNGFQSRILTNYVENLYCTELNKDRLIQVENPKIKYKICDAEIIDTYFEASSFDFIFSSNLFEHLPNANATIRGIRKIIKNEGIIVHVIPSTFSAIMRVLLWYPNIFIMLLEKFFRIFDTKNRNEYCENKKKVNEENNLKLDKNFYNLSPLIRFLYPRPHGVSQNIYKELFAFSKKHWLKEFENEDFRIIKVLKGPVCSGYGFGLDLLRTTLEKIGITSEYIFVAMKKINK